MATITDSTVLELTLLIVRSFRLDFIKSVISTEILLMNTPLKNTEYIKLPWLFGTLDLWRQSDSTGKPFNAG